MDILRSIEAISHRFSGNVGFAAKNLATGEEIVYNGNELFGTASTIKVPVLVEVFRQASQGLLELDSRVEIQESEVVGGSGILKEFGPGLQPTILDLCTLMVIVSDNTATNLLLDRIGGPDSVNRTMRGYGLHNVHLHNRIDFDAIGSDVRRFGEASPSDLMTLMEMVLKGEIVNGDYSRMMLNIMRRQQYLDQVPRYIQFDPYAADLNNSQEVQVACKTGFFPGTRVDTGAIYLPRDTKIAYCAMTEASSDLSNAVENEAAVVNGLLGRLVVEHWWPDETPPAVIDTPYLRNYGMDTIRQS